MNNGRSHQWSKRNWDRDGDTFCVKRGKNFKTKFTWHEFVLHRVPVKGQMKSKQLYQACKKKGLKPVCDRANWADGRCLIVSGHWHMSHPHHSRQHRVPEDLVRGAFLYTGRNNHQRAMVDTGNSHRWARNTDRNGDTVCAGQDISKMNFKYRNYNFVRIRVKGHMTSANILKACQSKKMRPVCDHSNYADGKCTMAGGSWHFSHPSHDRSHGVPRSKVIGAYFYCGRANGGLALMNTGHSHKWSHRNWDRDGDAYCIKRSKTFTTAKKWRGYKLKRVKVNGRMESNNIYQACKAKKMRPLCNHANYADGRCIIVGGNWHMSHRSHRRQHRVPDDLLLGTFTYCGRANGKRSLFAVANGHRWSRNSDSGGETICTKYKKSQWKFKWEQYHLTRIKVKGYMLSKNILKACKKYKLKPLCDHSSYADGQCIMAGGAWHFSHPHNNRKHRVPVNKVVGAYFYAGRANGGLAIMNTGVTHKWARRNWDRDGTAFCAKRSKGFKVNFKWHGHQMHRVVVKGVMNSDSIFKACQAKKMRPVCNHASYADGRCILIHSNWHFNHPHHARQHGVPRSLVHGTFTYCGFANHKRSLFNRGNSHRWSNNNDKNGQTICLKSHRDEAGFVYRHYHFLRVRVQGHMQSSNIFSACGKLKMRPVCDHANYADGKCRIVGGRWHFSHSHHARKYGLPLSKILGAYFYTGRANHGLGLMNTGSGHRWARRHKDRDGDTFCVKRAKTFKDSLSWRGFKLVRVPVRGRMKSPEIFKACKARGLRPVCNHPNYADGRCIIVGGNYHVSYPPSTRNQGLSRAFVRGTYTYCGYANGQRSLMDTGNSHRWSRNSDKHGETLCALPKRRRQLFVRGEWQMVRIGVPGLMTSPNILKACKAQKMIPVCDHSSYYDGKCFKMGRWHMSHPHNNRRYHIPVQKVKGAYFYCGRRNGGRVLMNTGYSHRWSNNGRDRYGDTFCARHIAMAGRGECNCQSVTSLMKQLSKVIAKCDKVEQLKSRAYAVARAAAKLGETLHAKPHSKPTPVPPKTAAHHKANVKLLKSSRPHQKAKGKFHKTTKSEQMQIFNFKTAKKPITVPALGTQEVFIQEDVSTNTAKKAKPKGNRKDCEGVCPDVRGIMREIEQAQKKC